MTSYPEEPRLLVLFHVVMDESPRRLIADVLLSVRKKRPKKQGGVKDGAHRVVIIPRCHSARRERKIRKIT